MKADNFKFLNITVTPVEPYVQDEGQIVANYLYARYTDQDIPKYDVSNLINKYSVQIKEVDKVNVDHFTFHDDTWDNIITNGTDDQPDWTDFKFDAVSSPFFQLPVRRRTLINKSKLVCSYRPKWHRYLDTSHFFNSEGVTFAAWMKDGHAWSTTRKMYMRISNDLNDLHHGNTLDPLYSMHIVQYDVSMYYRFVFTGRKTIELDPDPTVSDSIKRTNLPKCFLKVPDMVKNADT